MSMRPKITNGTHWLEQAVRDAAHQLTPTCKSTGIPGGQPHDILCDERKKIIMSHIRPALIFQNVDLGCLPLERPRG